MNIFTRKKKKELDQKRKEEDKNLSEQELVEKKVEELTKLLEDNLSYWKTFKLSIIRGFGAAVGATIIIAAAIYVMDRFFANIGYIPILSPILEYIYRWLEAA